MPTDFSEAEYAVLPTIGENEDDWIPATKKNEFVPLAQILYVGRMETNGFRKTDQPFGWFFMGGQRYALDSPAGQALNSLPATFKSDWGITVDASSRINVPNVFSNGYGEFFRPVDGTTRNPGIVEQDAARPVTATASTNTTGSVSAAGSSDSIGSFPSVIAGPHRQILYEPDGVFSKGPYLATMNMEHINEQFDIYLINMKASNLFQRANLNLSSSTSVNVTQANKGAENRPLNVGMTPVIYLGVDANDPQNAPV